MFTDIAIDWGTKNIGIAWGAPETKLVIPATIVTQDQLWGLIADRLAEYQVKRFIVGKPLNIMLQPTEMTQKVIDFTVILNQKFPGIVIEFQEERGTSKAHDDVEGRVDHLAAATILERFYNL